MLEGGCSVSSCSMSTSWIGGWGVTPNAVTGLNALGSNEKLDPVDRVLSVNVLRLGGVWNRNGVLRGEGVALNVGYDGCDCVWWCGRRDG